MAEVYNLSKARRRAAAPQLSLPDSLLGAANVFGFELPSTFTAFYLRRTKGGTTVFIKGGRLTLNLSNAVKTYPPTFKAARQWIAATADLYGWQMTETKCRR